MLVLAVAFTVIGCGGSGSQGEDKSAKTGGIRVASINWTNTHGWRITYEAQLKEVADDYIAKGLISEFQAFCPNQDPALEVQFFEQCINDGYDIILVNAGGSSGLYACFERALAAGIIVIPVDNLYPYPDVVGVQTDQGVWAGDSFEAMVKHFGGRPAKVVNFSGIPGTTGSGLRGDTWNKGLQDNPNFELVYSAAHSWSQTESKKLMSEVIASGIQYDAILTEEACVGILQAIEEANVKYPEFMSSDEEVGYIRMLDRINKNSQVIDFIVVENPPGIGASALKIAVRMAQGKEFKPGALKTNSDGAMVAYYTPVYKVTPATLQAALEQWKDKPDTDQMSTYLTDAAADAYFK
jgi:ribose transport system substrate-binding protein